MERHFEGTFIVREAGPMAAGVLGASLVGLGVFLAFGHHTDPGPVRPASAVTSVPTIPATTPAKAPVSVPGCVMFCDEPPLPPVQDSTGCRLFCDLSGGRS